MEVLEVHFFDLDKVIQVKADGGQTYILKPTRAHYYDVAKAVACHQQTAGGKAVLPTMLSEELQRESGQRGLDGAIYSRRKRGSLSVETVARYWRDRFFKGYWTVKKFDWEELDNESLAREVLEAVFWRESDWNHTRDRWLLRIGATPGVEIGFHKDERLRPAEQDEGKWHRIQEYTSELLKNVLSRLSPKFDPGLYVRRRQVEEELSKFLDSESSLFVIVGDSGTGKSNVICHLAQTVKCPVLVYSGDFYSACEFSLESEVSKNLEPVVKHVQPDRTLVEEVDRLAQQNRARFLICIDALNEFAKPRRIFQEVAATVSQWAALYPAIKLCVSCRTPAWRVLMRTAGATLPQYSLYTPTRRKSMALFPDEACPASWHLGGFDDRELTKAVTKYRRRSDFKGDLSEQLRELCANPLLLRLAARVYGGQTLPRRADARALWDAYWQTVVGSRPRGTDSLALAIASLIRGCKAAEVSEGQLSGLPEYSGARLDHLIEVGIVLSVERSYMQLVSFSHERFLEYALARSLLPRVQEILKDVTGLAKECESFSPLASSIPMFASMLTDDELWQFLHELARSTEEAKQLACAIVEAIPLSSNEAWTLLESLTAEVPFDVTRAIGEIGDSQPERGAGLISKMIRAQGHWTFGAAMLYAWSLSRLSRRNDTFLRAVWDFLQKSTRHKQVGILALSRIDDPGQWQRLKGAIAKMAGRRETGLRKAAASAIADLAVHDAPGARSLLEQMARDPANDVRSSVGWCLAKMVGSDPGWLECLGALARNERWPVRQVAARAAGLALCAEDTEDLRSRGEALAKDPKRSVRAALAEALLAAPFGRFRPSLLPLLGTVIVRTGRQGLKRLAPLVPREDVATEVLEHWSAEDKPKLREFAARIWKCGLGRIGMEAAYSLAKSRRACTRAAFAERLAEVARPYEPGAKRVLEIARSMLDDPHAKVRLGACNAVYELADLQRDECMSLILKRATDDVDMDIRRTAIMRLLCLDAEEQPQIRQAIDSCLGEFSCSASLVEVGYGLGMLAGERRCARQYVRELLKLDAEPYQQVGAVASVWVALFSDDRSAASECLQALTEAMQCRPCRAHVVTFALFEGFGEYEVDEEYKPNLSVFGPVLGAGFASRSAIVRLGAVWAAWRFVALYPTTLRERGSRVVVQAAQDKEWRLRFGAALYGGRLLAARGAVEGELVCRIAKALAIPLFRDEVELVRHAMAFTIAQFPEAERNAVLKGLGQQNSLAQVERTVASYAVGNAEEHFLDLVGRYYCQDLSRLRNELQFEVEALGSDYSGLLAALWRKRPDEVEALVEEWANSSSRILRKAARRFFRVRDRAVSAD